MKNEQPSPNSEWVRSIVELHAADLTRYAASILGDPDAAKDVVQDSFIRLWREPREKVEDHVRLPSTNYKDDMLEDLSNKGKGSYAYIDSSAEARKVFLEDLASNIFKIAKDVKIQVEFNPEQVQAYRLIGYENRRLKAEDFNNDKKKAGDIGPGHTVVAFYEIVPVGSEMELPGVDNLRYQKKEETRTVHGEVATVKLRYKRPDADTSRLITRTAHSEDIVAFERANDDFRFGAAVAAFGFKLRGSDTIGEFSYPQIERIATGSLDQDSGGHRSEFTDLVRKAEQLSK